MTRTFHTMTLCTGSQITVIKTDKDKINKKIKESKNERFICKCSKYTKNTSDWMDAISENLTNIYTPGYRETQASFKTFLNTGIVDGFNKKSESG